MEQGLPRHDSQYVIHLWPQVCEIEHNIRYCKACGAGHHSKRESTSFLWPDADALISLVGRGQLWQGGDTHQCRLSRVRHLRGHALERLATNHERFIETPMTRRPEGSSAGMQAYLATVPLARYGQPDEVGIVARS